MNLAAAGEKDFPMKISTQFLAKKTKWLVCFALVVFAGQSVISPSLAQNTTIGLQNARMEPGRIGRQQLLRIHDARGYMQPVQISSEAGVKISALQRDQFVGRKEELDLGMMVGNVYRLKLTHLPGNPGSELFPSIELIHRTYPPDGLANRFPVKVAISQDDIKQALGGGYVLKVIYLEDPTISRVQKKIKGQQASMDVRPSEDPLTTADMLGRPIAILRMGSKVPIAETAEMRLSWGPVAILPKDPNRNQPIQFDINNQKNAKSKFDFVPGNNLPRQGNADQWNMEHVFDGGDRNIEVHVDENWNVSGLESEDTVAHFDTLDGRRLVSPSNRVAIYSPQFASVRMVQNLLSANNIQKVARNIRTDVLSGQQRNVPSTTTLQQEQPVQARKANHVEGFHQQIRVSWSNGQLGVFEAKNSERAIGATGVVGHRVDSNTQKAWIAKREVAALTWGGLESVQAVADFQQVAIMDRAEGAAEIVEAHPPTDRPKLQVIKMADKSFGKEGDVINFTLRFKNVGDQKIGNVTLLDNLPERLEFVEGSAKCTLAGKFYTRPNKNNSHLLRWDVEKPMKVNDSGTISFRCRVR